MITRKHFEVIAAIIKDAEENYRSEAVRAIMCDLANYFRKENPAFDRERFMRACGF